MRLLLLLSLMVWSCSCQRELYTLDELPDRYLAYGQGGGFAGQETTTYLFPRGQRLQFKTLTRDTLALAPLKRRATRRLYALADSLFLQLGPVAAPGNRYQFIRYQRPDTLYRAKWGATDYVPAEALLRLYRQLTRPEAEQ